MNHVNYIFRGNCIKFFPEAGNISKSSIVVNRVKMHSRDGEEMYIYGDIK